MGLVLLLFIHATLGPMSIHFLNLGCVKIQLFFGQHFRFMDCDGCLLLHHVKMLTWLLLFLTWTFLSGYIFYALWNHIYFIYNWHRCTHIYSHHHPVSAISQTWLYWQCEVWPNDWKFQITFEMRYDDINW